MEQQQRPGGAGFTLIELSLVLLLIGIAAAVMFSVINPIKLQQRNRDNRRKVDIEVFRQALEQYRADHKRYPLSSEGLDSLSPDYIDDPDPANPAINIPKDPKTLQDYAYRSDGATYTLCSPIPLEAEGINYCVNNP